MLFKPDRIVVHHSLTKDSETVSWLAIKKYHTETLGFRDIGYHGGCELVKTGTIVTYVNLMGRPWDESGAHTLNQNSRALGFCFVGNFDLIICPQAQLETGSRMISLWMRIFGIPLSEVYPHSYFAAKTCPGNRFDMEKLKGLLQA